MKGFATYEQEFMQQLPIIINSNGLHAKWLNTLSYMENCGARKIARCQHPTLVKEEMLKHAAEEFRHAHYLKRQIPKISSQSLIDYSPQSMLGGISTVNYLHTLDMHTCRYLSHTIGLSHCEIIAAAYLLVTYAIELRADELYRSYDFILKEQASKITVKSILLEEKEHLREMRDGLQQLPSGLTYAEQICQFESVLCKKWLIEIQNDLSTS